jgi:hypothetical protein
MRMWVGAAAYLLASFALLQWGDAVAIPWRVVLALPPVLALAWMVVVTVLRVRQLDEYQLQLLVPGLAAGFTAMVAAAVTTNALSTVGIAAPNNGSFISLVGVLAWAITTILTGALKNSWTT